MIWEQFDDFHIDVLDTPDPSCRIDWVIAGGETGPGARHMAPAWALNLAGQCQDAGTAFYFKQMSNKATIPSVLQIREFPNV
jgi:protein gp37